MRRFIPFFLFFYCILIPAVAADDGAYQSALRLLSEGRIEEARAAFRTVVAHQPEHAGAWLDLAILQCGMGMAEEAETLFGQIQERFNPPPAIQELIQQLRSRGCQRQEYQGTFRFRFKLGRGHDSNANQGAANPYFSLGAGIPPLELAPEFRARGDAFSQVTLDTSYIFPGYATLFHAQIQARRHDRLSDYDLATLIVGVEQPFKLGDWDSRWGANLGATLLGDERYQEQLGAYVQLLPPWPVLPAGWQFSLMGDWTKVRYPTLQNFDADILKAQAVLGFRGENLQFLGNLGLTRDLADGARPGGDKYGWTVGLALRRRLLSNLAGELSWVRQDWRGEKDYSPGLINVRREQKTSLWRAATVLSLDPRQDLVLEYKYLDNWENISLFRYQSRQIMLNWQYSFDD